VTQACQLEPSNSRLLVTSLVMHPSMFRHAVMLAALALAAPPAACFSLPPAATSLPAPRTACFLLPPAGPVASRPGSQHGCRALRLRGGEDDGAAGPALRLTPATVTEVVCAGSGERVCIDFTSRLRTGEGVLVGSCSHSLALVHAETLPSQYAPPRPFRCNAGPVHAYCLLENGETTRYLCELVAGDRVLVADSQGNTRALTVGRLKIEPREVFIPCTLCPCVFSLSCPPCPVQRFSCRRRTRDTRT